MIFPNIFGSYDTRELPSLRIGNGATMEQVMADIVRWSQFFERAIGIYENALATRGTDVQGTFGTGTGGGELQPKTEYGEIEATRTESNEWAWGAPIRAWQDRQLYTQEYLKVKTLQEIQTDTLAATNRYLTTRLKMLLRALTGNVNWLWVDREFPGEAKGAQIPIFALFNADNNTGRVYVNNAVVPTGTLQHYLFSGSGTVGLANFTLGRSTLRDIGHTGRVVHLVAEADADTVRALPDFFSTATPAGEAYTRTVPAAPETTAIVTRPQAIGTIANGGDSDGEVVTYPFWPSGYTFSYDATKPPPLYIREHADASLRGFRLVQDESGAVYGDGDLRNKRWEFIGGAAIKNRANGVVVRAHATAYARPAI